MRLTILEHNVCDGDLTMTHAHASGATAQERPEHERLEKWLSAAAALAVGGAFFALWFLAPAGMARLPRRNGGDGALAMAGGDSIGAGIHGCSTLHLGLRVDGTRNPRAFRSTSAISSGGLLPLRA